MAPEKPIASSGGADETDLATAFQELAKGERTATAMENQLKAMEQNIEELLAQAEKEQADVKDLRDGKSEDKTTDKSERSA